MMTGESMKNGTLLLLATSVLAFSGCASKPDARAGAKKPVSSQTQNAQGQLKSAAPAGLSLQSLRAETTPVPRVTLQTTGKPTYTAYSPQPDVFILDFPRTARVEGMKMPSDLPAPLASVAVDEAIELGTALTRVTFRFTSPVSPQAIATGDSIAVSFEKQPVSDLAAVVAPSTSMEILSSDEVVSEPAVATVTVEAEETFRTGSVLRDVSIEGSGSSLVLQMEGDGAFEHSSFKLSNPLRLVVDLKGVKNAVKKSSFPVSDANVKRVRVSLFQSTPRPVTRVVLDLNEMVEYRVTRKSSGLQLAFGQSNERPAQIAAAVPAPVRRPSPAMVRTETAVIRSANDDAPPAIATIVPQTSMSTTPTPAPAMQQRSSTVRATTPQSTVRATPVEDVFVEGTTRPSIAPTGPSGVTTLSGSASSVRPGTTRTLTAGERTYDGDPISLNLKDADIKDVLRTFAQLTGLNIAIDPGVTGNVTVEFTDIPWDQAFEIILKQNGLGFSQEGNVIRIGTIDRLSAEQAQLRKLSDDQRLNVPLETVIKHLSYARATEVQSLLSQMSSPRGKIIVDARTNQLVITEIPDYLRIMLNLIDTVDIPTPQVVIEARIVETTKTFSRALGIRFGFNGSLDPALGTGTGLTFPSTIGVAGGPFNLAAGDDVLRLTLANVLGTFDLDVVLTAAENEGYARIISAPKVTTQDNQSAEIQSGVQIPIQTRVNFTTTVSYIDATLRLQVTPQITEKDTVIMDIQVQKVEPAAGLNVAGGQNVPLITRRAQTKLMVKDGGTAVIGGIYQATDNNAQSRVPFISSVPVIGNLFRNRVISSRHDELLIFITPRIVRNS